MYMGFKIDLILIAFGIISGTLIVASDYRGGCPGLADGRSSGCSVIGGLLTEVVFSLIFWFFQYWTFTLPALALPLLIGFFVDLLRKNGVNS